jgi:hypothetical protein
VEALDGVFAGVAVAAEDLDGVARLTRSPTAVANSLEASAAMRCLASGEMRRATL